MHEVSQAGREPTDTSSTPLSRDELRYRLRQQSLLGEFGSIAMQTRDFRKILLIKLSKSTGFGWYSSQPASKHLCRSCGMA